MVTDLPITTSSSPLERKAGEAVVKWLIMVLRRCWAIGKSEWNAKCETLYKQWRKANGPRRLSVVGYQMLKMSSGHPCTLRPAMTDSKVHWAAPLDYADRPGK
jgi:hypothetical protein